MDEPPWQVEGKMRLQGIGLPAEFFKELASIFFPGSHFITEVEEVLKVDERSGAVSLGNGKSRKSAQGQSNLPSRLDADHGSFSFDEVVDHHFFCGWDRLPENHSSGWSRGRGSRPRFAPSAEHDRIEPDTRPYRLSP